jgi:hypothetical protein
MAATQPSIQGEVSTMSRLVWVLNRDPEHSYKAEFQGVKIEIPADRQKIAKHVRDGGNLMEYLAARRFITDYKQPQGMTASGEFIFLSKELYDQELNEDELKSITGKSKADLKKLEVQDEKKARRKLKEELAKVPNKIQVQDEE